MTGIANLKLCAVSGIKLVKCGIEVLKDGKVGLGDLGVVFSTLKDLAPLSKLDKAALVPELSDLTAEEIAELLGAVIAELRA